MSSQRRIAIVEEALPHYRRPFYTLLREKLREAGMELLLVHGQRTGEASLKADTVRLPWACEIQNQVWRIGARQVVWQPCLRLLRGADLVVVDQGSRLLVNNILLLRQVLGGPKLALWGHGKNFQQQRASRVGEALKRFVTRRVHWFFAYTEGTAGLIARMGFPKARLTVVQNAMDTRALVAAKERLAPADLSALRLKLGLKGPNVGVFIGSMYPEKRLKFLIESCVLTRREVPDFELILIGAGVDAPVAQEAAAIYPWVRYVGPKYGQEKAPYLLLARAILMPGAVGLAILDSFALETPMVTIGVGAHGPEIEYLREGVNGVSIEETTDPRVYARGVADLLRDPAKRARLAQGCREAAGRYTVEEMASRFACGAAAALRA